MAILPFVFLEAGLRWGGWGRPDEVEDPYVGFTGSKPLFELNRATGRYEIPVSRQALFRAESFAAVKPAQEYRIFCLGGSTVQGRPYAIETSFTTWLELSLRAADPRRQWQVINCGGVSYASYRLVPLMRELLEYRPDLVVVYTGHNEFLEDRTYAHVKHAPAIVTHLQGALTEYRTYNLIRTMWLHASGQLAARSQLPADADPVLDYRGGFESYVRDDAWRDALVEHFRFSLARIIRLARQAQVPLVLCNPVANVKDMPPFKSIASEALQPDQRAALSRLLAAAEQTDLSAARQLAVLQTALGLDPRHPRALYLLGKCHAEQGDYISAKAAFLQAKDNDICPLRMLEPMHGVLEQLAHEFSLPLVDIRRVFESRSPWGIPGNEWLVDHVHPTIEGHQLIAQELMTELIRQRIVEPRKAWEAKRDSLYRRQRASLPASYFSEADRRRQGLRRWTSGRAFQAK